MSDSSCTSLGTQVSKNSFFKPVSAILTKTIEHCFTQLNSVFCLPPLSDHAICVDSGEVLGERGSPIEYLPSHYLLHDLIFFPLTLFRGKCDSFAMLHSP